MQNKHVAECTDGNFTTIVSQVNTLTAVDGNIAIQLNEYFICIYYTQMEQHRLIDRAFQQTQETQIEI
jgi:hypothetical protein